MSYQITFNVYLEQLENESVGQEYFIREGLHRLIDEMPLRDIKMHFKIGMIDPYSELNIRKYLGGNFTPEMEAKIAYLKENKMVEFTIRAKEIDNS